MSATTEPAAQAIPDGREDEAAPLGPAHEPRQTAALVKRAPLPPAVAQHVLSDDEMRRTWRMASALAASGMFTDESSKTTPEQAYAKILVGRNIGVSATEALMTIDIVRGSIQLRGVLLGKFVRQSQQYEYKVLSRTNTGCVLLMLGFPADTRSENTPATKRGEETDGDAVWHRGQWWEVLSREEFTVADAKTAGLVKSGSNWEKYPKNMCFWRALSNGVKFEAPDMLGGVPIYTEADEIPAAPSALGDGQGSGEPAGIDLGPDVEAVIARAAELGHAALADRGTVEMQLGDQPPERVAAWVKAARKELDDIPPDASVVAEPDPRPVSPSAAQVGEDKGEADNAPQEPVAASEASESPLVIDADRLAAMRRRVDELLNDADALDDTDPGRAQDCRDEAEQLMTAIESAADANQGSLL